MGHPLRKLLGRAAVGDLDRARVCRGRELSLPARVWRVGYRYDPLNPAPEHLYGWRHRFDDIAQRYRTVYSTEQRITAFREVLQDLRPSTKTIAEFRELFGEAPELRAAGTVTWAWREKNVLVPARIETSGDFVDLDDVNVIRELELQLAELLGDKDIDHLDISTLRSKDREVTQHISRTLYDLGAAGLRFRSNCDDQPCFVLYEDRAFLQQDGDPEPCTADIPELLQVCSDYGLIAERRSLA